MHRPCMMRTVQCNPQAMSFVPCGTHGNDLNTVSLTLDELEAIRLADYDGLYQEQAAAKMNISRQTFGNIIASAHRKVADFTINSQRLTVGGGAVEIARCTFVCNSCSHKWYIARGSVRPDKCPQCSGNDINCIKKNMKTNDFKPCWRNI